MVEDRRRWNALEHHKDDPFAHVQMVNRLIQENVTLRERYENRLSALESFKAQVIMLGGIGLVILGAVTTVVVIKVWPS